MADTTQIPLLHPCLIPHQRWENLQFTGKSGDPPPGDLPHALLHNHDYMPSFQPALILVVQLVLLLLLPLVYF